MPLEGTGAAAVLAADEVWELARSGHQPSGSFGEILDALVSSRPEGSSYTTARAALLDNLDALISSRAAAGDYSAARAAKLDYLDALISSRLAAASYVTERGTDNAMLAANGALEATLTAIKGAGWTAETLKAIKDAIDAISGGATAQQVWEYATRILTNLDNTRAAKIDNLDALISSRPAGTDYTAARAALLNYLDAAISSRAAIADYTAARAAKIDNLDAAISSRPAGSDYSATRAGYIDRLLLIAAGGAGELTAARAAKLDNLDAPVSGAGGGCNLLLVSGYPPIIVPSSATADTFGAWTQLYANVGANKRLYFVCVNNISTSTRSIEIEIGEGAANSEAAIFRISGRFSSKAFGVFPCFRSLTNNARLSARTRNDGSEANNHAVSALIG